MDVTIKVRDSTKPARSRQRNINFLFKYAPTVSSSLQIKARTLRRNKKNPLSPLLLELPNSIFKCLQLYQPPRASSIFLQTA